MNERIQHLGHLREEELKEQELRLRIEGLRDSIRVKLDPYIEVRHLGADIVAQQALELANVSIQYDSCLNKIAAIRRALGQ